MACHLCNQDRKLIRAHVIPRSFYAPFESAGQIVSNAEGMYPKRSPIGIYDTEILCEECERRFSPWDDYGCAFLMRDLASLPTILNGDEILAYNLGPANYSTLKLFLISVLWRADRSAHPMFAKVQLGPYADRIRDMLFSANAGGEQDFPVALSRFDVPANVVGILNPDRTQYEGVNHYRLHLGGFMAIIKVTNKRRPECFEGLYLSENSDVIVINREFRESKEFAAMAHVVGVNKTRKRANKSMQPCENARG